MKTTETLDVIVLIKSKINAKLFSYLILGLQITFSSWSWLFLFFSSFTYTNVQYGGLISAILFLSNAVVRVFFARRFSKIAQQYQEQTRLHLSVMIKLIFLFSLGFLPSIGNQPIWLILWSCATNAILVLDGYLSFHLKYFFADASHITLTRYNTLSNLGFRGSMALVSILAFALGKNNWLSLTEICAGLGCAGLLGSYLSVDYAKAHTIRVAAMAGKPATENTLDIGAADKSAMLGAHLLFLMNLFFGSGTLLFARAIPQYGLVSYYGLNLITFFYIGFIVVNIAGAVFDQAIDTLITWKNLVASYFVMAVLGGLFYVLRGSPDACFILAVVWGVVYGWGLAAFFPLISKQIRGKNQAVRFSKIDSESRAGFIISQLMTGFLLDALWNPLQLLQIYCIAAMTGFTLLLFFYKNKLGVIFSYEQSTV